MLSFFSVLGPAHYMTKEKPKSKEDQPSSTFVSATGRLHTPQGVVLVSVTSSYRPGSKLYLIGYFRVAFCLCFKTSPHAKLFMSNKSDFHENEFTDETHFITVVSHEDLF